MAVRNTPPMFLNESMRRKLEVASAMAWEALVEVHAEQAILFVERLSDFEPIEESLPRYLREMDVTQAMAAAIRTAVLTDEATDGRDQASLQFPGETTAVDNADSGWNLLRQPQRMVRSVIRRQRRAEEFERVTQLALAQAEENVILMHIDNAIGFVALFEDQSLTRAIQTYLRTVDVAGGRAQAVFQRTMARLAAVQFGPGSAQ